jgi:hypothetical protein
MTTQQKPNWDFWISGAIILAMVWFAYKTLMHGGE